VRQLASERPLALVVDDPHCADGASLRFLAFLLPRLEELNAVVLLGARPAEAGQSQELLAALMVDLATEVVTMAPLTTRGVATMVTAGLGVEPEPRFAARAGRRRAARRFWSARWSNRCERSASPR
jgi:predicted ATPase